MSSKRKMFANKISAGSVELNSLPFLERKGRLE